jgi:RHS repeat-associated protein
MNYSYDELNRLIGKVASDGSINYSYAYDGTGQGASVGRLTHSSNDVNAAHFLIYDVMGRVNQETYCIPSDCSYATSFHATYDLAGNVTSLTYPDGRAVNQTWDGGGHLTQVSDSSNGNIYLTSSSTYWPTGAPSAIFYGNGVGNGYDENNRLQINEIGLVRVGSSAPGNYTGNNNLSVKEYCYGPATSALSPSIPGCPSLAVANNGNIGQITDILNSADTQNFSYDSLNRISTFKIAGATNQTFQIDSFGNMTQSGTLNSGLTFLTNNNRTNTPGYVYDAAGDLTSSNNGVVNTYGYDAESKLVNVNNGVATYTYDADGNRVRKNSSGTWTEYVSFAGQILAEKSTDGTWSDYIFANGQRIARAENYDIRIHMSGTNCTGCGSTNTFAGTQSLTAANGTVVQTGDLLTWRQYQDGVAAGGIRVAFNNNTVGTAGVLRAADGQLADADTRTGNWYMRVADLSAYIGMSVSNLNLYNYQGGAPGNWDIYLGDISLVHPNGTVVPIYSRALSTLTPFQGAAESNVTVITEKAIGVNAIDTTYYSGDQIGSTSLLTDYAGWPISSELYYPFGAEPTPPSNSNHYKFTGKERDAESGLDYFGARYFGSTMGRFMSPDGPFNDQSPDNPQSWNLYSYGRNNPLIGTDPDGTTYNVCDSNGQNCSNIDDKTFEANQKSDQQNGVQYSNGTISQHDDNGNLVKSGTYSHDPDIAGDPASNIAAMGNIGNQGMSAIKVFVAGSVVGGTIGGVGLATGVIGGETGASLAGVGRSGASVANKLLHIFGNPEHGLGPLVQKLGGPLAAYEAIQQAAQEQVQANGTNGVFKDVAVTVGGQVIEVSGRIISGVVNIGTASGNLRH